MIVVDTSELKRPTQRKLHAAWHELHGRRVLAPPSVATDLAPLAAGVVWGGGRSAAETELAAGRADLPERRRSELQRQAWWAEMWGSEESPYRIVGLSPEQEELAERIRTAIDPRCFPTTDPEDIPDLADAAIVTESIVLGAKMLLTSNLPASTTWR